MPLASNRTHYPNIYIEQTLIINQVMHTLHYLYNGIFYEREGSCGSRDGTLVGLS
jgi:hypothetical protein